MKTTQNSATCFYGLGHSMIDYFAINVENPLLGELRQKSPLHVDEKEFEKYFKTFNPTIKKTGGTTVNILKTLAKYGANCFFSGSTGSPEKDKDLDALFFQEEMAKAKVECQLFYREEPTGKFLSVFDKEGNKGIVVCVGAAKKLEVPQLNEIRFAHCDFFVIEGMQFLNQDLLEQIVDFSFRYNVPLVVDCGTLFGAEAVGKKLLDIGQSLDIILFANEEEAKVLKNYVEFPEECCKIYVEKLGKKGSKVYFDEEVVLGCAKDFPKEKIKSETGAGDVFAGAFLHKLLEITNNNLLEISKENIKEALDFAALEASLCLNDFGV